MRTLYLIGIGLVALTGVIRADDISLGIPSYGGNGCPQNSVGVTLSPDQKQLSILFDKYTLEAKGSKTMDRKSCNLAIPVHVPQGLSVSILQVDFRGYNGLPRGASSQLTAEYFFADQMGPRTIENFYGELDDEYYVSKKLVAGAIIWSACGKDVNLRVNSSMRVRTNAYGEQAISTVDSVDVSSGIVYLLQWRRCR